MIDYEFLTDLVQKPISGEWGDSEGSVNVLRTTNFTNNGQIDFSDVVKRNISANKVTEKKLFKEDIIIEKSGGSPSQPVGRVVFFNQEGEYLCNNFTSILRPIKTRVFPKYLHYILFCNHKYGVVRKYQNKTTGIINLKLANYLAETKIPLPSLAEQKKIAAILDAADSLRQKDQQLVERYTALSQSLFLEMFGDPVTNPMGFNQEKLDKLCGVGSSSRVFVDDFVDYGVPFYRGTEVGKLGAGENITPHLFITQEHYESLKDKTGVPKIGDLLLPSICDDGRIYRVDNDNPFYFKDGRVLWIKVNQTVINSVFLKYYLKNLFKTDYSSFASGSTFAELKIVAVKAIKTLIPQIELQIQFAERIQRIEAQKQQAQRSLEKSEALFNSLLQRAFTAELTAKMAA